MSCKPRFSAIFRTAVALLERQKESVATLFVLPHPLSDQTVCYYTECWVTLKSVAYGAIETNVLCCFSLVLSDNVLKTILTPNAKHHASDLYTYTCLCSEVKGLEEGVSIIKVFLKRLIFAVSSFPRSLVPLTFA